MGWFFMRTSKSKLAIQVCILSQSLASLTVETDQNNGKLLELSKLTKNKRNYSNAIWNFGELKTVWKFKFLIFL